MKKLIYFCIALMLIVGPIHALQVSARATKHAAMPVLLVGYQVALADGAMHYMLKQVQKDLVFTQQFKPDLKFERALLWQSWQKSYPITAIIKRKDARSYVWQLYDGTRKKVFAEGTIADQASDRAYAHALADALWKELTGCEGFFSTRIAYCKEVPGDNKVLKQIFTADYDGSNEQVLVDDPAVNIAPRWNHGGARPLVFYSEFTDANVRMMYADLHKNKRVACDFDGTSMLPAFAKDGSKVVFCASNGNGTTQLYSIVEGKAKKLTNNSGNNFCPTLTEDGQKVYFCSDCGLGQPSLFVCDLKTKKLDRIAQTAGCESPCYSPANKRVAYCRSVKGVMQLFVYDTVREVHRQLTDDAGSKQGVSWSPCGNYVLYAQRDARGENSLYMMHAGTKHVYPLATAGGNFSYPNWSPRYDRYPAAA